MARFLPSRGTAFPIIGESSSSLPAENAHDYSVPHLCTRQVGQILSNLTRDSSGDGLIRSVFFFS